MTTGLTDGLLRRSSSGFLQTLARQKWILLSSLTIAIAIGSILAARQVPVYPSHSRILFEQYTRPGTSDADAGPADTYLNAQSELITSAQVLNLAAKNLKLRNLPTFEDSADIATDLRKGVTATVGKSDGIISVNFAGPIAADSAVIVNTVGEAYRTFELQNRKDTACQAVSQLQQDKDLRDAQVLVRMQQIEEFKKQNPDFALSDGSGGNIINQKLARLSDALTDAQSTTSNLQARCDALASQLGAVPSPNPSDAKLAVDDADVDATWVQGELDRASANVDALTARGLPATNTEVQNARAYLSRLHEKLAACQHASAITELARLRQDLQFAQRRQSETQQAFDAAKKSVVELNTRTVELTGLQEQAQHAQQASDELGTKIKQIDVAQDVPLSVRVLEPATPATTPKNTRAMFLGVATCVGLLLGLGVSFGADAMDQRLRSPAEIGGMLGLPVLGVVPHQPAQPSTVDFGLIAHTQPMSDAAEAARSVRTALFAASRMTPIKTVLISSPTSGDGRSTFAANLAIAMAKAGSKTLLIDTNAGDPAIQRIFEIRAASGLSEVLAGQFPFSKAVRRTPVEGLEVLPAGQMPMNSGDLLNSPEFSNLIEDVSTQYQCILLDSPAIKSAPDARILGAFADITLYVVRAGTTTAKVADEGLDQLLSVGSRVLGAVVNDVSPRYAMRRSRSTLRFMETPAQDDVFGSREARPAGIQARRNRAISVMGKIKKLESPVGPEVDVLD